MSVNAAPWLKEIESFEEAGSPVRATVKGLGPASFLPSKESKKKGILSSRQIANPPPLPLLVGAKKIASGCVINFESGFARLLALVDKLLIHFIPFFQFVSRRWNKD